MPTYTSRCLGCQVTNSLRLSFSDYEVVKLGVKLLECSSCQGKVEIVFSPGEISFVLKDGESGGWPGKALIENKLRARRREILAKKERDHVFKSRLIPNYKGMDTGTWKEAQEVARSENGNHLAATYDPLVQKEKAG